MVDRNKELAINTVILGIGQLIPKFLAILLLPLLTSYLTTDEYGNYDLILSIASLLIPIVTMQIQQAVFRYLLASKSAEDKTLYVTSSLVYIGVSSVICYPVVYLILRLLGIDSLSALLICVLFLSEALYSLLGQIVRGLGHNVQYSISVVVYSAINLATTAIMLMGFHLGLQGVIVSLTIGYLSADTYMMFASKMLLYFKMEKFSVAPLKELLGFSMPIVPSSIALWVVNLSDRLIIIQFMGAAANGIYAVANKIPSLYSTAYGIFNLAWTETASKVSDDGNPAEYYTKLFSGLFRFLIGVMLALIAITPIIFKVLIKGDYGDAFFQVPILYFGIFFNSLVNFYSGIYIALKRTKQVGYSSVAGAIINAAINVFLIGKIGLYAASISTAISFLVIAVYRAIDLGKVIKIEYNQKEILMGMLAFVFSAICLNENKLWTIALCWCFALIYNTSQNLSIIKKIAYKILRR